MRQDYRRKLPTPQQVEILKALQKHGELTGIDLINLDIARNSAGKQSSEGIYVQLSRLRKRKLVIHVGIRNIHDCSRKLAITPRGAALLETVGKIERIQY